MPDLPVAAPDPAAGIQERVDAAEADGWYGYDAEARADVRWLLAERQQDKELRERVEAAAAKPCAWVESDAGGVDDCLTVWPGEPDRWCWTCAARAALAVEGDADVHD